MNRIAINALILHHGWAFCMVEELFSVRIRKGHTGRHRDTKIVKQRVSGVLGLACLASYTWDLQILVV